MASEKALVTIILEDTNNDGIETGGSSYTYPLPEPASYTGTTSTMVDSGTSVSGKLLGSVVRSDMAQISMTWNYLDAPTWSEINKLFKDNYYRQVQFYDQTEGGWVVREMFISDRSGGMFRRDENGEVLGWTGCSLQLTEV